MSQNSDVYPSQSPPSKKPRLGEIYVNPIPVPVYNGTTNTIGDTDDEDADGAGKSPKIPLSNRSSPAKKSQLREIDREDLSHIRSVYNSMPWATVPDKSDCEAPSKPAEMLYRQFLKKNIRYAFDNLNLGGPAKPSELRLKQLNAVFFRLFLEENECDETDSDSDSDEEPAGPCEVCMKDEGHFPDDCPYLDFVPDPDNTPIGKRYVTVCVDCSSANHGHPPGTWQGHAIPNLFETLFRRQPTGKSDEKPPQPAYAGKSDEAGLDDIGWSG